MAERAGQRWSVLGVVSVVLAVLAGVWSAIGAWIPGAFVAVIALIVGVLGGRGGASGRVVARAGVVLAALVIVGSVVLLVMDSGS